MIFQFVIRIYNATYHALLLYYAFHSSGSLETRLCNGGVGITPHHNTMLSISYLISQHILSMTLIFAAEKEAEAARAKSVKATASPARKARRNDEGNYARFDSCASNLASILN
jgi:hypothetical protein